MAGKPAPAADRFWPKVDRTDGCWLWTACTNAAGYGTFWMNGSQLAHRVSYEWLVGPVPEGRELDHLCRVRNCVRPDHLEPVTTRTNVLRGVGRGAKNASKTHCAQGHELTYLPSQGRRRCLTCKAASNRRSLAAKRAAARAAA